MPSQVEQRVTNLEHILARFMTSTERSINSLSQEMKDFKDEMKDFKDEMGLQRLSKTR